uniref:PB2 n=1 Tax=Old quarry swamp virus TaxID=2485876 RepID=A0A3G3BTS8_9VIRU|nr:PB2 [Old quarry swamp virus]
MGDKDYFNHCLDLILNARPETIKLLIESPMSNVKLIERSAKCVKDPNPLASAMANMSLKYPLSIDKDKAVEHHMPTRFFPKDPRAREDTHYHGRILCSLKAVEWWVNQSQVPNEGTQEVIDILMEQPRKEVATYSGINWGETSVNWGPPNLERRRVATRETVVNIDPGIRDQALLQTMMPDFTTPYQLIPEDILVKVREVMQRGLSIKFSLSTQIRYLLNSMDPRKRVLPVLPGSLEVYTPIKHAMIHNNFVITRLSLTIEDKGEEMTKHMKTIALVARHIFHKRQATIDKLYTVFSRATFNGIRIPTALENPLVQESGDVKWLKALLNMRINSETTYNGLRTSPLPAKVRAHPMTNTVGTKFIVYNGQESVNFSYYDIRGTFIHNGQILESLTCNFTDTVALRNLISEVAVYCRWEMQETTSRSYIAMKQEVRDKAYKSPHEFIICSARELSNAVKSIPSRAGVLRLELHSEYALAELQGASIDDDGNIRSKFTNQSVPLSPIGESDPILPMDFFSQSSIVNDYLDLKRMIQRKIEYYIYNHKTLTSKINDGNYSWENSAVVRYIPEIDRAQLSLTCRQLLYVETGCRELEAFYYLFAYPTPSMAAGERRLEYRVGPFLIDLLAKKGILVYEQHSSTYLLFNDPLVKREMIEVGRVLNCLLDGFRLYEGVNPELAIRPINWLERHRERIEHGAFFQTYVRGTGYIAERDESVSHSREQTENRQILARNKWVEELHEGGLLTRKRPLINEVDEDVDEQNKRARVDEIADFEMMEDADYGFDYNFNDD